MAGMVRSAIRPILALALMLSLLGAEGAVAKPEPRVLVVVAAEPGETAAAKRLARPDSRIATICGYGEQVRVQLDALLVSLRREGGWAEEARAGVSGLHGATYAVAIG